jgi:hypothetical protein
MAPTEGSRLHHDGVSTRDGPGPREQVKPRTDAPAAGRGLSLSQRRVYPLTRGGAHLWLKTGSKAADARSFGRAQAVVWIEDPRGAPSGNQCLDAGSTDADPLVQNP